MKYKVGDRVRIKSLDWYNKNKDEYGYIDCGSRAFFTKMSDWCGKIATIKEICKTNCYRLEEYDFDWTDEMIEGLVEEETKPKFKVGDKITNGEITFTILRLSSDRYGAEDTFGECGSVCFKSQDEWKIVEEEMTLDKAGQITDFEYEGLAYTLPDGYQFVDENGNVINETKIILEKKKKEYPKTFLECCDVLNIGNLIERGVKGYKAELFDTLQKLYICRDAYWKIAGEEMELWKPWEPDWDAKDNHFYTIYTFNGKIKCFATTHRNAVLIFPTEEMRDVFYENFKEFIEACKELL